MRLSNPITSCPPACAAWLIRHPRVLHGYYRCIMYMQSSSARPVPPSQPVAPSCCATLSFPTHPGLARTCTSRWHLSLTAWSDESRRARSLDDEHRMPLRERTGHRSDA